MNYIDLIKLDYNEYADLSDNDEIIQSFLKVKDYMNKCKRNEIEKNNNIFTNYNFIIEEAAKFIKNLNIEKNPLNYSIVCSYLIWNGYLSSNTFVFDDNVEDSFDYNKGIDVIKGCGCCRNISFITNDILKKLNVQSYMIINNTIGGINSSFIKFDRKTIDGDLIVCDGSFENEKFQKEGNHLSNLIKTENYYYIFDPTNVMIFYTKKSKGKNNFELLGAPGKIELKPYSLITWNNLTNVQMNELMDDIFYNSNPSNKHKNKLEQFFEIQKLLNDNKEVFKDFNQKIKENILQIKSR